MGSVLRRIDYHRRYVHHSSFDTRGDHFVCNNFGHIDNGFYIYVVCSVEQIQILIAFTNINGIFHK